MPASNANDQEPGPPRPGDRLLTPEEVAAICGGRTTGSTVARNYKRWTLPAHKVGRELRFWESDVYAWIDKRRA